MHNLEVAEAIQPLATMIPLFFISTGYYGKRADIDWKKLLIDVEKSMYDPLDYVMVDDLPQQKCDSLDMYGALHWDYERRKQYDGAISENEVSSNVMRKFDGPKVSRQTV
ncbi:hypothetical protein HAX54_036499 [Datura stramonium]|uniref:Uncharacterized protein n=1 Tax=Datura stramonium TaxID=4076 RepID=A0ABS8VHT6_DATST|nr:hypothetical protein [Datura stramonium]